MYNVGMRLFRLREGHFKDLEKLLRAVGAVSGRQSYPQHVYMSHADYAKLRERLTAKYLRAYSYATPTSASSAVSYDLLNYGPNMTLGDVISPGWALVDDEGIRRELTWR
jgi:hypothetical protein